jgi:hypothetical protein
MRKSRGFRTSEAIELALYHSLGALPEPGPTQISRARSWPPRMEASPRMTGGLSMSTSLMGPRRRSDRSGLLRDRSTSHVKERC